MSPRLLYLLRLMRRPEAWDAPRQDFLDGLAADRRCDPLAVTK